MNSCPTIHLNEINLYMQPNFKDLLLLIANNILELLAVFPFKNCKILCVCRVVDLINSSLLLFFFFCNHTAPSQQPAPVGFSISYSSIQLSWHPPDSPNSNQLNYTLVRDGHSIHNIQRNYPFSKYVHVFKRR